MVAVTAVTGAQQRESANLSVDPPVPAWPANGVIPAELKDKYVFVDLAKNEYIIAFPENLGSPNFAKDGPADRRINRYKLQRDVEPKVGVAITPSTGGKFKYAYAVVNGPTAKQPIEQWALVLPEAASTASIKQPVGWYGLIQRGRKLPVANPEWIKGGAAAVLSVAKPEQQVLPGGSKVGFEIESDLKPGFTVGFFRQAESTDTAVQQSGNIPTIVVRNATPPPPAGGAAPGGGGGGGFGGNQAPAGAATAWQPIKDDIDKLLQFEHNSKAILTLAPKFDKSATDVVIAADFQRGITFLSRAGTLSADSAFVKGTLSDLDAYVKAGATGALKLSAQPRTDVETEVFNAMKVSLRLN
jgi:hypothetical protein